MKPRTLLVLFVLVAVLGAFIWFFERDLPSTDDRTERARKVLPLAAGEVTAVEIVRGAIRARLEKGGGESDEETAVGEGSTDPEEAEWRLLEPLAARADATAVGDLISGLTELEKERTLEDFDRAELGLDNPRATVGLIAGGEDWLLEVGEKVPASSSVIVALAGGDQAYVVSDSFWSDIEKAPGDWRSREAFPGGRDDIGSIRFASGGSGVTLERRDGVFRLVEPFADEADEERVEELLDAITDLEIDSFLDPPLSLAALGLDPPLHSLFVTLTDRDSAVEIRLGGAREEAGETLYAAVGEQAFETETDLPELLTAAVGGWQSTAWTGLEVYEIDAVDIRQGGAELRLVRSSGDWLRDGVKLAYTTVSDVLYALRDVEADAVQPLADLESTGQPLVEVTLRAGEATEALSLYPSATDGYAAQRLGREFALILDQAAVDEVLEKIDAVRAAEPIPAVAEPAGDEPLGD